MADTPRTNKIFTNSIPYTQDGVPSEYSIPVSNRDGTPIGGGGGGSLGAEYNTTLPIYANEDPTVLQTDERGRLITTLGKQIAGERLSLDVLAVEQQFTYSRVTADTLVKTGPGFLHTLTFAQSDPAPTAGSINVYDNTAESGTLIYTETFTTDIFRGYTVIIDANFSAGLYVGFTTTNDIGVTCSYR